MSLILYASIPRFERKLIGLFRKLLPILLLFAFSFLDSGSSSWAGDGDWQHAPRPRDYPAHKIYRGKPASVRLESPKAKLYRTVLRKGAKGGPNFAGHYTVIAWGCGLDSFELAVVDAMTGEVWFPPFGCIDLAGGFGLCPPICSEFPNPAYWIDSRLLIIAGVEYPAKIEDRSFHFYEFAKGNFRLVYSIPDPWE